MNITTAFRSLLSSLVAFFSAAEKVGKTLDNLAEVAYQTSAAYVDTAAADREDALEKRRVERAERKAKDATSTKVLKAA